MIAEAVAHRGFSYLHVLSPCVTFDKTSMTYQNLNLAVRELPEDRADYMAAVARAQETQSPALGVYYRETRPTLSDSFDETARRAGSAA